MKRARRETKLEKKPSYLEAQDILSFLHTGESCMRNYVAEYFGKEKATEADYETLFHYRQVLIGVAKNISKSNTNKKSKTSSIEGVVYKIKESLQLELFR